VRILSLELFIKLLLEFFKSETVISSSPLLRKNKVESYDPCLKRYSPGARLSSFICRDNSSIKTLEKLFLKNGMD